MLLSALDISSGAIPLGMGRPFPRGIFSEIIFTRVKTMNASELKEILLSIVQKLEDFQVNQDVLAKASESGRSLGDLLDAKRVAEERAKDELSAVRKQIEELA